MKSKKGITVLLIVLAVALLAMFFMPSKAAKANAGEYVPDNNNNQPDSVKGGGAPAIPVPRNTTVKQGSSGPFVTWLQAFINYVNWAFGKIPPLTVDGKFGPKTAEAAQKMFGRSTFTEAELMTWHKAVSSYMNNQNQPATIVQVVLKNIGISI